MVPLRQCPTMNTGGGSNDTRSDSARDAQCLDHATRPTQEGTREDDRDLRVRARRECTVPRTGCAPGWLDLPRPANAAAACELWQHDLVGKIEALPAVARLSKVVPRAFGDRSRRSIEEAGMAAIERVLEA